MLLLCRDCCEASANLREVLARPRRLSREPAIRAEHPWEASGVYCQGSLLHEDGRFRLWYSAIGERRREQQYLAYAESPDGLEWTKPLRPEWGFGDWPATNVLYGHNFNISAPNVHRYSEPREGYRYFLTFDSRIEQHAFQGVPKVGGLTEADRRRLMRHPAYTPGFEWEKYYPSQGMTYRATYLADSVDGFAWEPSDGRFGIPGQSDGDHTTVYDPVRRIYRMYLRDNRLDENGQRIRQVVTATSRDTIEWSPTQLCLESDAIDDPREHQIHGMTVTWHDGWYIGLVQVMDIQREIPGWHPMYPMEQARFHVQLAVSRDGVRFHRVAERAEFFSPGEPGAFDAEMVRSAGQWAFDGDRMLMAYDGRPYPHIRNTGEGVTTEVGIGIAESPRDRFAGLTPVEPGRPGVALVALPPGARRVNLNCDVPAGAEVRAALHRPDGSRILSHTEAAAGPLREGGLSVPLTWNGSAELPAGGTPLSLRLSLQGNPIVYALYTA